MESKRQRLPSVRLGEVGEIPAAVSCGILQTSKVNLESKRQRVGNQKDGFASQLSAFTSSDSTETQTWGNSSPNSIKEAIRGVSSDETSTSASKPRLTFGALAPKVRVTKRGRSVRCSGVMGSSWHSGVSPGVGNGNGKVSSDDAFEEATSDMHAHPCVAESSDPETSNMSKGSHWDHFDDPMVRTSLGGAIVNNIKGWLDNLGFGKYAQIFEMHEVDCEVLPLLTFEDLKEIGVNTVGSRRKMFNAIQLLKDGVSTKDQSRDL